MNRALGTQTIMKYLTQVSYQSQKKTEGQRTEKVAEISPNLEQNTIPKIQEGEQTPNKIQSRKFTPRHIIFKLLKAKDSNKKS